MKVTYNFKDIKLGELSKVDNKYIYNSNIEGERKLKQFCSAGRYLLFDSNELASETLFEPFAVIVSAVRGRWDLSQSAKLLADDDDYTVLTKYAMLEQDTHLFWVGVAE